MDPDREYTKTQYGSLVNLIYMVDKYLSSKSFSEAKNSLAKAEQNGATYKEIAEYKEKITTAEAAFEAEVKHCLYWTVKNITERKLDEAKKCIDKLQEYKKVASVIKNETVIEIIIENLQNTENIVALGQEVLAQENHEFTEIYSHVYKAKNDSAKTKIYGLSELFTVYENRIKAEEIIYETEKYIASAKQQRSKLFLDKAKENLLLVKEYNIPLEKITELENKILATSLILQKESDNFQAADPSKNSADIYITLTEHKRKVYYGSTSSQNDSEFDEVMDRHGNNNQLAGNSGHQNEEHANTDSEKKATKLTEGTAYTYTDYDTNVHAQTNSKYQALLQPIDKHCKDNVITGLDTQASHLDPTEKAINNHETVEASGPTKPVHLVNEHHNQEHPDKSDRPAKPVKSETNTSKANLPNHEIYVPTEKAVKTKTDMLENQPHKPPVVNENTASPENPAPNENTAPEDPTKPVHLVNEHHNQEHPDKSGRPAKPVKSMNTSRANISTNLDFSLTLQETLAATSQKSHGAIPKTENDRLINDKRSAENYNAEDNLATKTGNMNIDDTRNNNLHVTNEKPINSAGINMDDKIAQKVSNTRYALEPKENNCVHSTDDEETGNFVSKDNVDSNRDEAMKCLEKAKDALEEKDFDKAERLALNSNKTCNSEDAIARRHSKTALLKEVKDAKNCTNNGNLINETYGSGVKSDGSYHSVTCVEDLGEARRCLDIACAAFNEDKIEKCRRFLKKAKTFDNSVDIECYLSRLQKEKVKGEIEKQNVAKETQEKPGVIKKFTDILKNTINSSNSHDSETKAKIQNVKAHNQDKPNQNDNNYKGHDKNRINVKDANNAETQSKKNYNKKEIATQSKKNNIMQEINTVDNDLYMDGATGGGRGNDDKSNKSSESFEVFLSPDEEAKKLKSESLVADALKCIEAQDFERAESLLTTAQGLYPTDSTALILEQAKQESAKMMIRKKEELKGKLNKEEIRKRDAETKPTTTYIDIIQQVNEKVYHTRSYSRRTQPYEERAGPIRSTSRIDYERERPRNYEYTEKRDGTSQVDHAKALREMGIKAFHAGHYNLAEILLVDSDRSQFHPTTNNYLRLVRSAKNKKT